MYESNGAGIYMFMECLHRITGVSCRYTAFAIVLVIGLSMPAVRLFQALDRGRGRPAVIEKVRRTGVMKNGRHELVLILNVKN
nr:hypothetical protein [Bacillus velezensis]